MKSLSMINTTVSCDAYHQDKNCHRSTLYINITEMSDKPSRLLMFLTSCLMTYAASVPPIALWPLNREHRLQDISGSGNHGNGVGVSLTSGVYGERGGATMFTDGSYVEFDLDSVGMTTEHSMTILAFVYPTGTDGPVVQILTEGNGVRFGQKDSSTLFISLDKVDGTRLADLTARHALTLNSWNFIGATYSSSSGAVQLWHGGLEVASTVVGREQMAVGGTVRVGFSDEVGGSFRGKVACVQLYDVSLNQEQIEKTSSRCTGLPEGTDIVKEGDNLHFCDVTFSRRPRSESSMFLSCLQKLGRGKLLHAIMR
uniref:LamG-like jellyroll fold domain-containing protein n=1 Tax=Branchiostoma floridae TaxID=7739 RepID=C3Y4Z1_BRAFL|eukprot:XP_002608514.1 hypothetical protein BRAFLDRAFT_92404 [Branchiostoma floridae]